MNIFAPYHIQEETASSLHLTEARFRRNIMIIATRVFPLVMIVGMATVIANNQMQIGRLQLIFMTVIIAAIAYLLFTRKIPLDIFIDKSGFAIQYQQLFSINKIEIPLTDIEMIRLRIKRGKAPGYFYSVVTKTGERFPIFKLRALSMTDEKQKLVRDKLFNLTGLSINN